MFPIGTIYKQKRAYLTDPSVDDESKRSAAKFCRAVHRYTREASESRNRPLVFMQVARDMINRERFDDIWINDEHMDEIVDEVFRQHKQTGAKGNGHKIQRISVQRD